MPDLLVSVSMLAEVWVKFLPWTRQGLLLWEKQKPRHEQHREFIGRRLD